MIHPKKIKEEIEEKYCQGDPHYRDKSIDLEDTETWRSEQDLCCSIFERLIVRQPAIAYQLGLMAGYTA